MSRYGVTGVVARASLDMVTRDDLEEAFAWDLGVRVRAEGFELVGDHRG